MPRALTPFARFFCFADRLRELSAGTAAADLAIHRALGLPGEPRPYTRDEATLRTLLPDGFEMYVSISVADAVYGVARLRGTGEGLEELALQLPSPPPLHLEGKEARGTLSPCS